MALTRKLLKELQLSDEAIEQIIAAHAASIQALKTQRDELTAQLTAAQQSAADAQAAFDAYRAQADAAQQAQAAVQLLRQALMEAGCNEQAVELIAQTIDPATLTLENGALANEGEIIAQVKERYAAFFAKPVRLPTPDIQPPIPTGGALTREDLARMSADEINRNWNAVKGVLAKGAI